MGRHKRGDSEDNQAHGLFLFPCIRRQIVNECAYSYPPASPREDEDCNVLQTDNTDNTSNGSTGGMKGSMLASWEAKARDAAAMIRAFWKYHFFTRKHRHKTHGVERETGVNNDEQLSRNTTQLVCLGQQQSISRFSRRESSIRRVSRMNSYDSVASIDDDMGGHRSILASRFDSTISRSTSSINERLTDRFLERDSSAITSFNSSFEGADHGDNLNDANVSYILKDGKWYRIRSQWF